MENTVTKNVNELHKRVLSREDRIADAITAFAGSMRFVYAHIAWFGVWIFVNLSLIAGLGAFDPYPFGLLTMVVSLEAIFLSTFVMIAQNRQSDKDRLKADADYEVNLKAELEISRAVESLKFVEAKLDAYLANSHDCICRHPFFEYRGLKCGKHRES